MDQFFAKKGSRGEDKTVIEFISMLMNTKPIGSKPLSWLHLHFIWQEKEVRIYNARIIFRENKNSFWERFY